MRLVINPGYKDGKRAVEKYVKEQTKNLCEAVFDLSGEYDNATDTFTANTGGVYTFCTSFLVQVSAANFEVTVTIIGSQPYAQWM